jgi:thymidine phosphorylase
MAAWRAGAGRARKEDPVSDAAGVVVLTSIGTLVTKGQPLFELHADDAAHLDACRATLRDACRLGDEVVNVGPTVLDVVRA